LSYIGKTPTPAPLTSSDITDGIISNSKLAQDIISAETELATAPADTDELLISDAGTLKRIDASLVGGGGITEADYWRLTTDFQSGTGADLTANLERVDSHSWNVTIIRNICFSIYRILENYLSRSIISRIKWYGKR